MTDIKNLKTKIFVDGADLVAMKEAYNQPYVKGFTTNPTLMKKAGISDYETFAKAAVSVIPDRPISFEVFSDDFKDMEKEARAIASWGENVYVKIPITNTKRESSVPLIRMLSEEGLQLNITAILTLDQVRAVSDVLNHRVNSIVSVFAGRIADTGRDPIPLMSEAAKILKTNSKCELLWASSRELLNLFQAESCGCHIITLTNDIVKKTPLLGKDLGELSLDTVRMFYNDARAAGYSIFH